MARQLATRRAFDSRLLSRMRATAKSRRLPTRAAATLSTLYQRVDGAHDE